MSSRKPDREREYWVEVWGWESPPYGWELHSIHADRAAAEKHAERKLRELGSVWRVVAVTRYPLKEFR